MSSLFIGLGGVGTGVLDSLYDKMKTYNNDLQAQGRPQVSADYYYIDTENTRYANSPNEFGAGSNKKFLQIGLNSPDIIVASFRRSAQTNAAVKELYDLMQKWYDAPSKTTSMLDGADTVRQYSRLAFCEAIVNTSFYNDLTQLITNVHHTGGRVYVITGSCGGTGCGIYMDLLYAISKIFEDLTTATQTTNVRFIMAMPEGYISSGNRQDVANMKMRLNAFATLEELNAICKEKDTMPSKYNGCYVGSCKKRGPFQPFRFGYLYDTAGKSIKECSIDLSDFLFELELASDTTNGTSTTGGYTGSEFDALLTGTVDGNWNASINDEYVKAFNAIGRYSIEKPDFLYRKYLFDRLLFDVFHKGLIGENKSVDEDLVHDLAVRFTNDCDCRIHNTCDIIRARYLTRDIFHDDYRAAGMFSVLTQYPNEGLPEVQMVLEAKDILLSKIREWVYSQCREWLLRYDFATVCAVLERLDVDLYAQALSINQQYTEMLDNAKEASKGGFLRRHIQPERAMEQFGQMLNVWLTFEVSKALSSGIGVDIAVRDEGYLDYCKAFVDIAKRNFRLEEEQEHWDVCFIKNVNYLKQKNDRSYIPNLDTLVDYQCNIVPDSPMVVTYDRVVVDNPEQADFTQGTCTPATLHEKIMLEMRNEGENCHLDELLDPTPGSPNSLRKSGQASRFAAKYVETAKKQIDLLLAANNSYQQLFEGDILTRLQNLPQQEKAMICLEYAHYDDVQLRTVHMISNAISTYTYHILSNTDYVPLMQALGILTQNGNRQGNSDISAPTPFYADKIVKLIVKTGYKLDDYRYFDEYKEFAEREIKVGCWHDSFIDKRFLGTPDMDGKYPCDVSAALEMIEQAKTYSLDGCDAVEIYKYCLALLYEYYDVLKQNGHIEPEFENAISHTQGTTTIDIRQLVFNRLRRKFALEEPQTIDLASLSSTNNMKDLTNWIQYILPKKKFINNECRLYGEALDDFGLEMSDSFNEAVGDMMGEGYKPVYDFFNAYLDWYRRIIN